MKRKIAWIARCVLCIIMTFFLISISGLVGLIDFLQFVEVFLTAILISIVIRVFKKRGVAYFMEWTSLIAGMIWSIINLAFMWKRYVALDGMMFSISILSVWYGLLFSIWNSWLISLYKKNKDKKRKCS